MSFFENQMGILSQCTYESAVIVSPGVIISSTIGSEKSKKMLLENLLSTALVSFSYFVSCVSKYEILSLKSYDPTASEDAALTVGAGIASGFVSYGVSYSLDPDPLFSTENLAASVFMSTGYSLAFNYVPRPYLTAAIFVIELKTATLPGLISSPSAIKETFALSSFDVELTPSPEEISGVISGIVFSAIDLAEFFVSSYCFKPPSNPHTNESIYYLENIDMCPTSKTELPGLHIEL